MVAGGRECQQRGELQRSRRWPTRWKRRGRGLACRSRSILPGPDSGRPDRQGSVAPATLPGSISGYDPAPRRKTSKTIVAVNKDEGINLWGPRATGVVGDLFKVAPAADRRPQGRKTGFPARAVIKD